MEDKMKIRNLCATVLVVITVVNTAFSATKALEWKFENDLNDTSGNGINGIAWGGPAAYDTGVSGQAFVSDGNNSVYKTGINTAILPVLAADTWTVNIWVCPNGPQTYIDVNGVQRSWRMAWRIGNKSNNSRTIYCSDAGFIAFTDSNQRYIGTGIPWDVNQWQMITTTYDGSNVRVYKNGLLIGKKSWTFQNAPGDVNMPDYAWSATTNFFKGKFDEFTVWRGALTQQEIIALIPPGTVPEGAYLDEIAYYTLDDPCEDGTMPDHSGHSNTATLYNYGTAEYLIFAGPKSGSLLFDNQDSGKYMSVDLPTGVTVSQYAQHSVAFWFKSGYQPYNGAFYSEGIYPKTTGSQFLIRGDAGSTGTIKAYSKDQNYNMQYSLTYDASAYMNGTTWHHLAVTSDGDKAKLYLDGQVVTDTNVTSIEGKGSMNQTSIGFNWDSLGYLATWDKTYLDDFHIYKGVLTQGQVQAMAARGNVNNDFAVDFIDFSVIGNEWRTIDTTSTPGSTLLVDNMEGSLAKWSVYVSGTYTGTGTISATTNAYAGAKAMQWDYNLPARVGGNYTSIVYDFGAGTDLAGYDAMKLYLYRHAGNTPEEPNGVMYVQFYDASNTYKAESLIYGPNSVVLPANQWDEWYINLNVKLHSGSGYVDKTLLNNIRYIVIGCGSLKETARTGAIDFDEITFARYPICSPYLDGDIGPLEFKDCKVDLNDLAVFAEDWLIGAE